jgi:tryptophanyl-tRNA synthetase
MSGPDAFNFFEEQYNNCNIRYGDLKKHLAEDIVKFTEPIRNRILELSNNEQYISKVARLGAEKARESGRRTVNEVRDIIGFKSF